MKFSAGNIKEKNLQHRTTVTIQLWLYRRQVLSQFEVLDVHKHKVIFLSYYNIFCFLHACSFHVLGLQYIDLINTRTIPGNKQDNIPLGNEQSNQSCFFTLIVCDKPYNAAVKVKKAHHTFLA